ncbi:MAG: hydrogenobyrinic acid a,c-diamide synthase (glutamine-hydrolyzing) [candidate division Zixibacteria bacterium]|nr:hydrogenobyrinic acid a,c-diamide synthase (glutamine-hydrolyzing) [candidate division Zixibacteria bacterium]
MSVKVPRLIIAGLSGDSGKTIVSLSLLAALGRRGQAISVFKKGPDYIDAAWLSFAAGCACRNLDTYMVSEEEVRNSFVSHTQSNAIAVVEGNRGLFDGKDTTGTHSTAELAKLLDAPVVLVIDATKVTRTVAAMINGCRDFDSRVNITGVVLNRVAGKRHQRVLTDSIEQYCGIPVLGCIPKMEEKARLIPGRHLGLVTPAEYDADSSLTDRLVEIAERYLDVDALTEIAMTAAPLESPSEVKEVKTSRQVRIGVFRDSVFTFYYPENLEALESCGAELVPISSLVDHELPDIDGLYIGGGFPETHAERLTANRSLMQSVRKAALGGLPVYAECGGLIYLCRSLMWRKQTYPMAGVFDIDLEMHEKPFGHGYTELLIDRANPFFNIGAVLKGHEFHYTGPDSALKADAGCAAMTRGSGLGNSRDGLMVKNTLALYTHLHALGVKDWARAMVSRASERHRVNDSETKRTPAEDDRRTKKVRIAAGI